MSDFIPGSDGELLKWTANFSAGLPNYAKDLGLTQEQVELMQSDCANIDSSIDAATQALAAAKEAVAKKLQIIYDGTSHLRTGIGQFKKNAGYTEAIGKALGVMSTTDSVDPNTYKPKLSADVFPGHVTLKFTKKGVQGVNIYSQLKGQQKWEKLAFDSYSPYEDNRPLNVAGVPEVRQYMAMGVVHDHEIGHMSDIVEILFGG